MRAFTTLSRGRNYTFGGALPISFEAIDRYAMRYEVCGAEEFERFLHMILRLDAAFMKAVNKKDDKKKTNG